MQDSCAAEQRSYLVPVHCGNSYSTPASRQNRVGATVVAASIVGTSVEGASVVGAKGRSQARLKGDVLHSEVHG